MRVTERGIKLCSKIVQTHFKVPHRKAATITIWVYLNNEETTMISVAHAQAAAPAATGGLFGGGDSLMSFLPMILMFVVLWFIMIRPQMKRQKETKAMVDAIKSGDEVITAGGILGKVTKVTDQYIVVEVAAGSEITMQRSAVAQVLPKGTLKSI